MESDRSQLAIPERRLLPKLAPGPKTTTRIANLKETEIKGNAARVSRAFLYEEESHERYSDSSARPADGPVEMQRCAKPRPCRQSARRPRNVRAPINFAR